MDIGKFHYFLKSQFTDKNLFDDCCGDSFFNEEEENNLVQKSRSVEKNNLKLFDNQKRRTNLAITQRTKEEQGK